MAKIKVMIFYPGEDMVGHLEYIEDDLDSFQRIVGGSIEHSTLRPGWGLWFNDEFRIRGLPINETASALWHLAFPRHPDFIGGTAFITGQDRQGNETDIPSHVITWMEAAGRVVIPEDPRGE